MSKTFQFQIVSRKYYKCAMQAILMNIKSDSTTSNLQNSHKVNQRSMHVQWLYFDNIVQCI